MQTDPDSACNVLKNPQNILRIFRTDSIDASKQRCLSRHAHGSFLAAQISAPTTIAVSYRGEATLRDLRARTLGAPAVRAHSISANTGAGLAGEPPIYEVAVKGSALRVGCNRGRGASANDRCVGVYLAAGVAVARHSSVTARMVFYCFSQEDRWEIWG